MTHDKRGSSRRADPETLAAREAELSRWLEFNPEPPSIPCDASAREALGRMGIEVTAEEEALLARYLGMLFAANERFNLTRIDAESAWSRHIVDSLTLLAPLASLERVESGIDIGSGGGLPGIPLAIARSDIAWTLVESTAKKARFLEAVARRLGLANVSVVQERAEHAARGALRERFDVATSRAVGALDGLARISIPLPKRLSRRSRTSTNCTRRWSANSATRQTSSSSSKSSGRPRRSSRESRTVRMRDR
jgi:16S rRNA (guanine527-N7)-methyltransferase